MLSHPVFAVNLPANQITMEAQLLAQYLAEADAMTPAGWEQALLSFDDASIYQTWEYGAVRWGERNISHLVLKRNGQTVCASQARILQIPWLRRGICYIPWGPLFTRAGHEVDALDARRMAAALREEYAEKRRLLVRVRPNAIEGEADAVKEAFLDEGFTWRPGPYRTILLDLALPIEELTRNLNRSWRRNLKKAGQSGLELLKGSDMAMFELFEKPYRGTVHRKHFTSGANVDEFRSIQERLPEALKMRMVVAELAGKPAGSLLASHIGNKCVLLLGGSNDAGLDAKAFHKVFWEMLLWMKAGGARWYDTGGVDPQKNPGTAFFKEALGGRDVRHVGEFEISRSLLSKALMTFGDRLLRLRARGARK